MDWEFGLCKLQQEAVERIGAARLAVKNKLLAGSNKSRGRKPMRRRDLNRVACVGRSGKPSWRAVEVAAASCPPTTGSAKKFELQMEDHCDETKVTSERADHLVNLLMLSYEPMLAWNLDGSIEFWNAGAERRA